MDHQREQELWTQYLDGRLDPSDAGVLWTTLRDNDDLRAAALDDLGLDGQLRLLSHVQDTQADFVMQVMSRLPDDAAVIPPPIARDVNVAPPRSAHIATQPSRQSPAADSLSPWYVVAGSLAVVVALLCIAIAIAFPNATRPLAHDDPIVPPQTEVPVSPLTQPDDEAATTGARQPTSAADESEGASATVTGQVRPREMALRVRTQRPTGRSRRALLRRE